ncbi:Hypothetical protein KNT65_gp220 [Escherichia phage EcS1]|uniref:Uncharacterized protein n=1 Tax=Escherichia phage EcS1 TaxID=2083276 RepID=A0A2Z5ZDA5_9CAUD|nr:Hypothetical protein KNT65_gp220 [Escherichia phage EcS1]BBC78273.1 Hypothetical protein [Escherichia phage EcS1]
MELNHWYKLADAAEFVEEAPTINTAVANYLSNKPFMITELVNNTDVLKISFDGKKELYRLDELGQFSRQGYGDCWIYGNEYQYFTEVKDYEPEKEVEPVLEDLDYGCLVAREEDTDFLIRAKNLSEKQAEEWAAAWLHENTYDEVIVFKGISRFKLVKEPQVVKSSF